MSTLFVVATPIGNLEDISARALRILSEVDLILAEDTRNTKNLLNHFQIKTPVISYHQHSKINKTQEILAHLQQGHNLALVSDAGTPGISDPGNKLIDEVNKFVLSEQSESKDIQINIAPIPGASAVTALASVCGFPMDRFVFLGFPPAKNKRKKFFEELLSYQYPVVFYESPYRILNTLRELGSLPCKEPSSLHNPLRVVVGRELTKKFETIYRGTIEEVLEQIKKDAPAGKPRGEFTIVLKIIKSFQFQ